MLFELMGSGNAIEGVSPNAAFSSTMAKGEANKLSHPDLIKLYNKVVSMEITGKENMKFHKSLTH
jgi:hypothetical protein